MKIMFELVTVVFSLNCVYPVLMYYIYDDNPIAGYVSTNEIGTYPKNRLTGHKKYFASANNQKNMKLVNERAVDSHFKTSKASPISFAAIPNMEYKYTPKTMKGTEPPQQKTIADVKSGAPQLTLKTIDNQNSVQSKKSVTNDVLKHINEGLFSTNLRNYFENLNVFNEMKIKELNAHKPRNSMDAQKKKSKLNNRRPYIQQNYFQNSLASSVKNKVLHKANINNEQNVQLMTYMLNEIAQKYLDRKSQKQGEYRKRDAISNTTINQRTTNRQEKNADHNNKHVPKETGGINLKNGLKQGRVIPPRIGSYDLGIKIKDTPYALFYRMNHENIAPSDFFPSPEDRSNVDEPTNIQDNHRITMTYAQNNVRGNRRSINRKDKNKNYAAFRDR